MPNVPYLQQPYAMNLDQPNVVGAVQTGLAAFGVGKQIAEDMQAKKSKRSTERLLAKWSREGRQVPNMEEAAAAGADPALIKDWAGLSQLQATGDANMMRDLALLSKEYVGGLSQVPADQRIAYIEQAMQSMSATKNPGHQSALKMINGRLQSLSVDPNGQPIVDAQGEPVITDEAIQSALGQAQHVLLFDEARRGGQKQRAKEWKDLSPTQKIESLKQRYPGTYKLFDKATSHFALTGEIYEDPTTKVKTPPDYSLIDPSAAEKVSPRKALAGLGAPATGPLAGAVQPSPEQGGAPAQPSVQQMIEDDPEGAADSVIAPLLERARQFGRETLEAGKEELSFYSDFFGLGGGEGEAAQAPAGAAAQAPTTDAPQPTTNAPQQESPAAPQNQGVTQPLSEGQANDLTGTKEFPAAPNLDKKGLGTSHVKRMTSFYVDKLKDGPSKTMSDGLKETIDGAVSGMQEILKNGFEAYEKSGNTEEVKSVFIAARDIHAKVKTAVKNMDKAARQSVAKMGEIVEENMPKIEALIQSDLQRPGVAEEDIRAESQAAIRQQSVWLGCGPARCSPSNLRDFEDFREERYSRQ